MDWHKLAGMAVALGKEVLPEIIPGAGPAIAIAEKAVALGRSLLEHAPPGADTGELELTIDQLVTKVMEHADSVANQLGDGPT